MAKGSMTDEDKEKGEWARHYDSMLWLATSIFLIAIAQLATNCCTQLAPETGLLGLLITGALLYFAASFRQLKHKKTEKEEPPRLRQWPVYVLVMFFIGLYWINYLRDFIGSDILWIGIIWGLVVGWLFCEGR